MSLTLTLSIWLSIVMAHAGLCAVLNLRNTQQDYPAFYRYAFFQCFASATGFIVRQTIGGLPYFITYYLLTFIGCGLAFAVAHELTIKLLGPAGALPEWATSRLTTMIGTGIAAALTVSMLLRATRGGTLTKLCVTAEQWMTGAEWVTFCAILVFWRTLRVFRRQKKAASICLGFVFYLMVSMGAVFVCGHHGTPEVAEMAKQAEMLSYLLSLLWWIGVIMAKAPVFDRATAGQVRQVADDFLETSQAAIRAGVVFQAEEKGSQLTNSNAAGNLG